MSCIAYPIRNSLYLNITDRCTLECRFCPKHTAQGPVVHDFDLGLDHRPEVEEIISAIGDPSAYDEVVFCGFGEPTLRLKVLLEVARWIKDHGGRVRINTDGLANLVNKRNVLPEMAGLVDSLSVSMNAQDEETYNRHCQPALPGSWQAMLDFLAQAPEYVPRVTATAIDGLEGVDIEACEKLATERGVAFRRRELDKVG
ncbi:TatD family nuclease-associated radical SAM protein [Thiolapillus sp.]